MSDDAYVDYRGGALLKGTWECYCISKARFFKHGSDCCRRMFFDHRQVKELVEDLVVRKEGIPIMLWCTFFQMKVPQRSGSEIYI